MLRSVILAVVTFSLGMMSVRFRMFSFKDWVYAGTLLASIATISATIIILRRVRPRRVSRIRDHCAAITAGLRAAPRGSDRDSAIQIAQQIASDVEETGSLERLVTELEEKAEPIRNANLRTYIDRLRTEVKRLQGDDRRASLRKVVYFGAGAFVLWLLFGVAPIMAVYALDRWQSKAVDQHPPGTNATTTPGAGAPGDAREGGTWKSLIGTSGTLGDTFGAVNALFSALALAGAIYSILLQTRELGLQREEMAMNRRELTRTAEAQIQSERSFELQTRLAAYQSLADHHRYQRDTAGKDRLLEFRSKGRERAYAELVEVALRDLEAYSEGARDLPSMQPSFFDHPARIRNLYNRYVDEERDLATDHNNNFGVAEPTLLSLAEEIAALTEVNRKNDAAKYYLLYAGHSVNAAMEPAKLVPPEFTSEDVRTFQIQNADLAFKLAYGAIAALNFPAQFVIDTSGEPPATDALLAMYLDFSKRARTPHAAPEAEPPANEAGV